MSSFQILRQCTAALSSGAARRAATADVWRRSAAAAGARRWYSDGKASIDAANADASKEGESVPPESECEKKLKAKEAEVVDLTGRLRYLQADFLNLQRNAAREKEQTKDFAISRFAGDLLETVDVLALALKSVPESALPAASGADAASSATPAEGEPKSAQAYLADLHQGVELTHRVLLQTLFKYHVKPFDPTGEKFDPNRHEALYQAPVPGKEPGSVIHCQKSGYMIKERVLRAAQVGVAQERS